MDARVPNADLGEILVFTRVVRGGSFTAAAISLGMPKSTVSRKISELEARVGARLLQRTTRSVSLTDVGRAYYEYCARIVAELEEAEQVVAQMQATPRGLLRIATPVTFSVISPVLADYMRLYPEVQVEVFAEQRRVDLVEERFDLSLRAGALPDTTLVARKVGVVRRCVLGAPALLGRLDPLRHPSDLERHDCLVFAPEGSTWTLGSGTKEVEVATRPRLLANDYDVLRGVARAGVGLALLPEYHCIEDVETGRLARALPGWSAREIPIFAMYPSTRHLPAKVSALLELLRERLALTLSPSGEP